MTTNIQARRDAAVAEVRRLLEMDVADEMKSNIVLACRAVLDSVIKEEEAEKAAYVAEALKQWEADHLPPYLDEHERSEVAQHAQRRTR